MTFTWSAITDTEVTRVVPGRSEVVPRSTGRIRIPAGRTRATVAVPVVGNDLDGDDVALLAGLTTPSGAVLGENVRHGLVTDDDPPPTVRVAAAAADEDDGYLEFRVTLSRPSDRDVSVSARVSGGTARRGADWQLEGGTLLSTYVPLGSTTATFVVPLVDDRVAEPTETLTLELLDSEAPVGEPRSVVGTIRDDD